MISGQWSVAVGKISGQCLVSVGSISGQWSVAVVVIWIWLLNTSYCSQITTY